MHADAFIAEISPRIRRYMRRMVGDAAEDATQEALLRIACGLPEFRGDAAPSTWAWRVAANTALDWLRSRAARPETTPEDADAPSALPDRAPGVEEQAISNEMSDCILALVCGLPDRYRCVILLREYEGLSQTETAEAMDESEGNVKVLLHRARAKLKEAMERYCVFYRGDLNQLLCDRRQEED